MANEVVVKVTVDDAASRPLSDIKDRADGSASSLGSLSTALKSAAIIGAATAITGALVSMTMAAAEDEASTLRLSKAIENTGLSFDYAKPQVDALIASGQRLAFSDDQVRGGMAILVAQTNSLSEAQKRFTIAMDLSRGANIDVVTAARLLGKVTDENISVLSKYQITVAKGASETELFGAIQEKFGGQAEAFANSAAGQAEQVKIGMSEATEAIGYLLLPAMVAITAIIKDYLIPAVELSTNGLKFFIDNARLTKTVLGSVTAGIVAMTGASAVLSGTALPALIAKTWLLVAALSAKFIAMSAINPAVLLYGTVATGAAAALIYMATGQDDVTEASNKSGRALNEAGEATADVAKKSRELVANLDAAARAFNKLSFEAMAAKFAQELLSVGSQDYEETLAAMLGRLNAVYTATEAVRKAKDDLKKTTDFLIESVTGEKAAQDALAKSKQAAADGERAAQDALTESKAAARRVEEAAARAADEYTRSLERQKQAANDLRREIVDLTKQIWATMNVTDPRTGAANAAAGAALAARVVAQDKIMKQITDLGGTPEDAAAAAAAYGGSPSSMPQLAGITQAANGGYVERTGLAVIHQGETVTPASGGSNIYVTVSGIVGDAASTGRAIAEAINAATKQSGPVLLAAAVQ